MGATGLGGGGYASDDAAAAGIFSGMHAAELVWGGLQPAIEAAATLSLLEWQHGKYEDIEAERIGYIEAAQKQWCGRMNEIRAQMENVIDDIPEPAMFDPVSASGEQLESITDNLQALEYSEQYVEQITKFHLEHDLARQVAMNDGYYDQTKVVWDTIGGLLLGELPTSDVVEILSDTAEQAILTGKIGNSQSLTFRNLGISQLRAQALGRQERREELTNQSQNISSPSRSGDVRTMEIGPAQRISWSITQGQLIQNALQNAYNACSKKAPYLWHQMQTDVQNSVQELQLLAGKANLVNSFVPNYAGIFQSQVSDLSSALIGGVSGDNSGGVAGGASSFGAGQTYNQGGY